MGSYLNPWNLPVNYWKHNKTTKKHECVIEMMQK